MIDECAFLRLAQALAKVSNDEVEWRNVASRAYYGAYHVSQTRYQTPVNASSGGMHKRFIDGLKASPDIEDRKIGFMMQSIYDARIDADYKIEKDFPSEKGLRALEAATRLEQTVKALP